MKYTILFLLLFVHINSNACLNYQYAIDKDGNLSPDSDTRRTFSINFDLKAIEKSLIKLEQQMKTTKDYKLLSDYGVLLLKSGKVKEALEIFIQLNAHYPNDYKIAANLGTAYELNGDVENALKYIKRGMEINPDAHEGSEWVHVKVLETKQKLASDPNYLATHTVLGLTEKDEKKHETLSDILIQVRERFPFTPGPDKIMASIMMDLGDCYAYESIEFSKALYTLAKEYYGADPKEADAKIAEMVRLRNKYADVQPEKYEQGEGSYSKTIGIRYKNLLDDENPENYKINWSKITTDPDKLLAYTGLEKIEIKEEKKDTLETKKNADVENKKNLKSTPGKKNNVFFWIIANVLVLGGIVVLVLRRRRK